MNKYLMDEVYEYIATHIVMRKYNILVEDFKNRVSDNHHYDSINVITGNTGNPSLDRPVMFNYRRFDAPWMYLTIESLDVDDRTGETIGWSIAELPEHYWYTNDIGTVRE